MPTDLLPAFSYDDAIMTTPVKNFLATVEPFTRLSALELEGLMSTIQEVSHSKGETIYSEGEKAQSVWVLKTGRLEIFKYSSEGKSNAIESIMPKGIYGMYCRIGNEACSYPCTAVAAMDSTSLRIPDKIFWNLFKRSHDFVMGICSLCSQQLNGMQDQVSMSHEPVQKRIVKTLINLSKKNGTTLPFTKREIAELSATTVETAIRTLSEFEKKKWISSERGKITLVDMSSLEALIN